MRGVFAYCVGVMQAAPRPSFAGFILRMNRVLDTDGRPLGERRVPRSLRPDIPFETRECPYQGSRQGLPMNASALRQMTDNWPAILQMLRDLRRGYLAHHGLASAGLDDLLGVCIAGVALPAYLMQRCKNPVADGELPATVAAVYKVLVGVLAVVRKMVVDRAVAGETPSLPTHRQLSELAETTGRLVADGEACAGPPHLMGEALECIVDRAPQQASGDDSLTGVGVIAADFFEVATCTTDLTLFADVFECLDSVAEHALLRDYVRLDASSQTDSRHDVRERARNHFEVINRQPVRSPTTIDNLLSYCRSPSAALEEILFEYTSGAGGSKSEDFSSTVEDFLATSNAGVPINGTLRSWLAREILSYCRMRQEYLRTVQALDQRIAAALGQSAPWSDVPNDRTLFPRLHAHAWLEALGGVRIEINEPTTRLLYRESELIITRDA